MFHVTKSLPPRIACFPRCYLTNCLLTNVLSLSWGLFLLFWSLLASLKDRVYKALDPIDFEVWAFSCKHDPFCRFMKLVNSVINFDTVHFHSGSNKFAISLALFFQMFRLLNFKWDGSHRVRPSCDNFRSKLVDPSFTQESESTGNNPQKHINIEQKSDQDDYELQVSQLEEFCAKMTQYQAHMKALEGILMKNRTSTEFFKNGTSSLPPKMLNSRKKISN